MTPDVPHRRHGSAARRTAAIALAVGALACFLGEAVVAAAWKHPSYSYVNGYISDLASRDCGPYDGRSVCSPRWAVIGVVWVSEGLLLGGAAPAGRGPSGRSHHGSYRRRRASATSSGP